MEEKRGNEGGRDGKHRHAREVGGGGGGGGGAWTWPGAYSNMSRLLHRPWTF